MLAELTHNDWITVPAAAVLAHVPFPDLGAADEPGPFSLADPDRISDVLARAGFADIEAKPVEAPLRLGSDADDTVVFLIGTGIARALLDLVDPDVATRAIDALRDAVCPYERPDGLALGGAAWLVTAHRT